MLYVQAWHAGQQVRQLPVPHGQEPHRVLAAEGWRVDHPVEAELIADDLLLRFAVEPMTPQPLHPAPAVRRDRRLVVAPGETAVVKQRWAAYAVIESARGVLAAQYSSRTEVSRRWGMPGGGLEPGEGPREAVRREVWEETGQEVVVGALIDVSTSHWLGRAPSGRLEDFQAIRLTYRADCPHPSEAVVHEVDGTTADARWVVGLADVDWAEPWRRLLPRVVASR